MGSRASGPTRVIVEKPNTLIEENEFEQPKGEPAPVHRFVRLRLLDSAPTVIDIDFLSWRGITLTE